MHDCTSVYRVPLLLNKQGVLKFLIERLSLPANTPRNSLFLRKWKNLADRFVSSL